MNLLLMLPILIPLMTAIAMLTLWCARRTHRPQRVVGHAELLGPSLAMLAAVRRNGVQSTRIGSWPAPFGITVLADLFSAIMLTLTGLMRLSVAVYSLSSIHTRREAFGYWPLLHILRSGVCGSFLTGDI